MNTNLDNSDLSTALIDLQEKMNDLIGAAEDVRRLAEQTHLGTAKLLDAYLIPTLRSFNGESGTFQIGNLNELIEDLDGDYFDDDDDDDDFDEEDW